MAGTIGFSGQRSAKNCIISWITTFHLCIHPSAGYHIRLCGGRWRPLKRWARLDLMEMTRSRRKSGTRLKRTRRWISTNTSRQLSVYSARRGVLSSFSVSSLVCSIPILTDVSGGTSYFWWILLGTSIAGTLAGAAVLVYAGDGSSSTWRLVRCFAGFVCSMVWIAAIADEVVGVLKVSRLVYFTLHAGLISRRR